MIFVECKPDLLLVKKITGMSRREITHSGNKGEVIKHLSRSQQAIGLIDEDPGISQPKYLNAMSLQRYDRNADLKIYEDRHNNLLIILCPVLEEWILKTARLERVQMSEFNLPEKVTRFKKIINLNLQKFEWLLDRLQTSPRMATLRTAFTKNTKNPS